MWYNLYKKTLFFDLEIIESTSQILITQRWKLVEASTLSLSVIERFKQKTKNIIETLWNYKFWVKVKGESAFAKKHEKTTFEVRFQIEWVSSNAHWQVTLSPQSSTSSVNWVRRIISLDIFDIEPQRKRNAPSSLKQYTVAHEFGHTIGNVRGYRPSPFFSVWKLPYSLQRIDHDDEYPLREDSSMAKIENQRRERFFIDKESIMNVGNEVRARHSDYIILELNTLMYGADFYLD